MAAEPDIKPEAASRTIGPEFAHRLLMARIRKFHAESGMTRVEVAKKADVPTTTVDRWITGGKRKMATRDVRDLCEAWGLEPDVVEQMRGLAILAQSRGPAPGPEWRQTYQFGLYLDLEQVASEIRTYEPITIPGLLQTPAFAEEVVRATGPNLDGDAVGEQIRVRIERQAILRRAEPVLLHAIIDESALWRSTRDPATMRDQLQHVLDVGAREHVTIQVVPFSAGPASAAPNGAFVLMDVHAVDGVDGLGPVAYQETAAEGLYPDSESQTDAYRRAFDRLSAVALSETESARMIMAARDKRPITDPGRPN